MNFTSAARCRRTRSRIGARQTGCHGCACPGRMAARQQKLRPTAASLGGSAVGGWGSVGMAVGFQLQFGSFILNMRQKSEQTLMDGISAIVVVVLGLGMVAAIIVWLCSDPDGDNHRRKRRPRHNRAKPGLQAEDVQVGCSYKLQAPAVLRLGPQLDSPRTGILDSGKWLTVKAIKILPGDNSGTGKEAVRLCCADGRGWCSLQAKDGTRLFHPGCRETGLTADQVTVGSSYRVRSVAAVRTRAELVSAPAAVEFLQAGDWMTVGDIRVLSAEESGTGEEVVRLRCKDGRGWVSLRAKCGRALFDANATALGNSVEHADDGSSTDADVCDNSTGQNELLPPDAIVGSVAVLQDMLSTAGAKLNGSVVTVVSYDAASDRFGVRFQDGSQKAVRLRNLGPVSINTQLHKERQERGVDSDGNNNDEVCGHSTDNENEVAESDDDYDDDNDDDDPEIDMERTGDGYETVGRAPRHVVRYRVVANRAVIRAGMEISCAQVGELVKGDIVDGWEEMGTEEGHTRLRISENEWVSRVTASGKTLLQSENKQTSPCSC